MKIYESVADLLVTENQTQQKWIYQDIKLFKYAICTVDKSLTQSDDKHS